MNNFQILIVDDSKTIHKEIKEILKSLTLENIPVEFDDAYSFSDFRRIYQPGVYALVLTDLVMETEDAGIKVINYIRHEVADSKTRIALMTANPEKVPQDILIRDYDVNAYIEKKAMNEFSLKINVFSLLRTYKDIIAFEKAITSIDHIIHNSSRMDLNDILIEAFFQIRSFLTLKMPNNDLECEIYVDNKKIFPPKVVSNTISPIHLRYIFEEEIVGKYVKMVIVSSKNLSNVDKDYIRTLLLNIKHSSNYLELLEVENELVYRLANLIETRSEETGNHVKRVSEVSYLLALDYGFSEKEASIIKSAAGLHDVGKVGIPDHILNKPGKLSNEEYSIMKEHALIGFELLKSSKLKVFEIGAVVSLQHHERWDGEGYPYGLEKEESTPEARIVQVADVFEALTHNRCYRPAWPVEKAIEYMLEMSGKQFDPGIIEIFKKRLNDILEIFKIYKDQ
jgi:response regulator RpfG family c-di-GMP phosphodiesterase